MGRFVVGWHLWDGAHVVRRAERRASSGNVFGWNRVQLLFDTSVTHARDGNTTNTSDGSRDYRARLDDERVAQGARAATTVAAASPARTSLQAASSPD
jgi:hypothetical protein